MWNPKTKLIILYCFFAFLATCTNILSQEITMYMAKGNYDIIVSIGVGTIVGLLVKYILDKKYIFSFTTKNLGHDGKLFMLYSAMGIITTLIFWMTEYTFDCLYDNKIMRYLGAVLGLFIGYIIKYRLDKRFVFSKD